MPVYEYKCVSCERHFEKFQSVTEEPASQCVYCSGPVKRVIHPVGVIFKGSGFYVTDSRSGSKSSETKEGSESE